MLPLMLTISAITTDIVKILFLIKPDSFWLVCPSNWFMYVPYISSTLNKLELQTVIHAYYALWHIQD